MVAIDLGLINLGRDADPQTIDLGTINFGGGHKGSSGPDFFAEDFNEDFLIGNE